MLDVMYERLSDEERRRILKRYKDAAERAKVQKIEQARMELARARERENREEQERREQAALLARIEQNKLEKQRAEILARMQRREGITKREPSLGDRIAEAAATSDMARKAAIVAQEITNSDYNPASVLLRLGNLAAGNGYQTGYEEVVKPETMTERALGAGVRALYDYLAEGALSYGTGKLAKPKVDMMVEQAKKEMAERAKDKVAGEGLGRAYDMVRKNPFTDNPKQIVATFEVNGKKVGMTYGAAVKDGEYAVVRGKPVKKVLGTKRNDGMVKEVYVHDMSKKNVEGVRRSIRKSKIVEVTESGKQIYERKRLLGKNRITALRPAEKNDGVDYLISSDYFVNTTKKTRIPLDDIK